MDATTHHAQGRLYSQSARVDAANPLDRGGPWAIAPVRWAAPPSAETRRYAGPRFPRRRRLE